MLEKFKASLTLSGRPKRDRCESLQETQLCLKANYESKNFMNGVASNAGPERESKEKIEDYGCYKRSFARKHSHPAMKSKLPTSRHSPKNRLVKQCPTECICQGGNVFCNGNNICYKEIEWDSLVNRTYMAEGAMCRIYSALYKGKKVVIKVPREDCDDPETAEHDLEVELEILSALKHRNIVKLIGAGLRASKLPRFIVVEHLDRGTLADRFLSDSAKRNDLCSNDFLTQTLKHKKFHLITMLERAAELAEAVEYLHHRICGGAILLIHRDLKPDNIGVKSDGTFKLLDFGLARCVRRRARINARYDMTGETGSMRYMAPEVINCQPYNEKVDVYAFGLLLWEILEFKRVYEGMSIGDFTEYVVEGGVRPPTDPSWPPRLKKLLSLCWHMDVYKRPDFRTIVEELRLIHFEECFSVRELRHKTPTEMLPLDDDGCKTNPAFCTAQCMPCGPSVSSSLGKSHGILLYPRKNRSESQNKAGSFDTRVKESSELPNAKIVHKIGLRFKSMKKRNNCKVYEEKMETTGRSIDERYYYMSADFVAPFILPLHSFLIVLDIDS